MEDYRTEPSQAANSMALSPLNAARGAMVSVEQTRAIAEVQAAIVIAKANPRDEAQAEYRIVNACKRISLAEGASYSFKRGTEVVTGPSIRLAETLARHWGNMNYGFREIGRDGESSEVETYCHDYETNVRVSRTFQVRHWRDKKSGGGTALTSERDKYEHIASQAQRRVRACILEIIPGDIAELAEESCKATLTKSIGNVEEKVKQIVESFAKLGVTDKQLESYLQRPLRSIVPADVVNLMRVFRSIRDGIASASEFFETNQENTKAGGLNERFKAPPQGASISGIGAPPGNLANPANPAESRQDVAASKPSQPAEEPRDYTPASEEPPPEVPQSSKKGLFQKFQEQICSKETSIKLDQWAKATHDNREKQLTDDEHQALMHDIAERRAELQAIENEQAGQ